MSIHRSVIIGLLLPLVSLAFTSPRCYVVIVAKLTEWCKLSNHHSSYQRRHIWWPSAVEFIELRCH